MGHYGTLVVAGLNDHTVKINPSGNIQLHGGSTFYTLPYLTFTDVCDGPRVAGSDVGKSA